MRLDGLGKQGACLAAGVCMAAFMVATARGDGSPAGIMAAIELRAVSESGVDDVVSALSDSQDIFAPGSTIFVEVWAQTSQSNGFSSVSADVIFDPGLARVESVTHTALFSELRNGVIDNVIGLVDNLSGSHLGTCGDQVGVAPNWSRVAIIQLTANAAGTLVLQASGTGSAVFGTALCGLGDLDPATITFGASTVQIFDQNVPTVSAWGLIALTLLIVVTGTLVLSSRLPRDQNGRTTWTGTA